MKRAVHILPFVLVVGVVLLLMTTKEERKQLTTQNSVNRSALLQYNEK